MTLTSLLDIYTMKIVIQKVHIHTIVHEALFTIPQRADITVHGQPEKWIKKAWHICTENVTQKKRRTETVSSAAPRMDLGTVIRVQDVRHRRSYSIYTHVWKLGKGTDGPVCTQMNTENKSMDTKVGGVWVG